MNECPSPSARIAVHSHGDIPTADNQEGTTR